MTFREYLESGLTMFAEKDAQLVEWIRESIETFDREQKVRREMKSEDENL